MGKIIYRPKGEKMENTRVNINKNASLKVIENQLELFAQAIIKKNCEIESLKKKLDDSERNRVKLAREFAKKKKVLV